MISICLPFCLAAPQPAYYPAPSYYPSVQPVYVQQAPVYYPPVYVVPQGYYRNHWHGRR